jgi:hypothetical protein
MRCFEVLTGERRKALCVQGQYLKKKKQKQTHKKGAALRYGVQYLGSCELEPPKTPTKCERRIDVYAGESRSATNLRRRKLEIPILPLL